MDRGDFTVITSTVILLEVPVHPLRANNTALVAECLDILLNSNHIFLRLRQGQT
jgi:hypothetical protein